MNLPDERRAMVGAAKNKELVLSAPAPPSFGKEPRTRPPLGKE